MSMPAFRSLSFTISVSGILIAPMALPASSRDAKIVSDLVAERQARDAEVAAQIWQWAEVGYQEKQSSALLQTQLREAGFDVKAGVAAIPTAFIATAGSGKPVIGILAEFDALPGFSQDAKPERSPIDGDVSGKRDRSSSHGVVRTLSIARCWATALLPSTIAIRFPLPLAAESRGEGFISTPPRRTRALPFRAAT
jgi:aminobenzoyl-glutamate utilization protein B